jgi:hypothetical protein
MGCVCAIVYTCFGAAYGTAQAGVGICSTAVLRPDLGCKEYVMSEHRKILRNGFAVKAVKDRSFSLLENVTLIQMRLNKHSSGCDGWHNRDLRLSRFRSCRK